MPMYVGFYHETIIVMSKALNFVEKELEKFFSEKKSQVNEAHHPSIDKEHSDIVASIDATRSVLKGLDNMSVLSLDEKTYQRTMDILRSALEVYLRDTLSAKEMTGLATFNGTIGEINRMLTLEGFRDRKTDLFAEFFPLQAARVEGSRVEIFLSYAHENRALAGTIAKLLEDKVDVFRAHEKIEISDEWRQEILKHLKNDRILLALLTKEYADSVWANQEAGYMLGKGGKIVPLIVDGIDLKEFGFVESYQGIPVKSANVEECIDEILGVAFKE